MENEVKLIIVNCETGSCNDGTNMWDYDLEKIRNIFIWASDSKVIDLSKKILDYKRK